MKDESTVSSGAVRVVPAAEAPGIARIPLNMTKKTMAKRMTQSAQEIPQFAVSIELDADELAAGRGRINASLTTDDEKVSVTALLIWLTGRALCRHPLLNARFDQDAVIMHEAVNIAVAMDTADGLKAPVIRNAGVLELIDINRALKDLSARAGAKKLAMSDFADATFTISNLGMMGVTRFTPLVNPPQAAILGVGGPRTGVKVQDGKLFPVQTIELTVSADHRILDGATVARFLQTLKESVNPMFSQLL